MFGPPKDRDAARSPCCARRSASGVNHIDTSDFYGPHVTNQLIREALHPYPDDLVIVTKIGARRGADASWIPAMAPAELESAVHDNLRNLGLDALEVVNLRIMGTVHGPAEGSIEAPLTRAGRAAATGPDAPHRPQQRHADAGRGGARGSATIVCVQNQYNLAHRDDDALIDELAARRASPTCRSSRSAASRRCSRRRCRDVAASLGATPMQVALAWLLRRAPNILLIPGTSSLGHLRENLAAANLELPREAAATLDEIATGSVPA